MGETGKTRHGGRARALVGRRGKLSLFGATLQCSQLFCDSLRQESAQREEGGLALGFLT